MSRYFNRYTHTSQPNFNGIVDQSDSSSTFAVGNLDTSGLLALISAAGTALYAKTYTVQGETVKFVKAVETTNNEFIIYGYRIKDNPDSVVLRVKADGTLVWARYIVQSGASEFVDLIRLDNDNYVFLTKIIVSGYSTFEIVKISGSGVVSSDYQVKVTNFDIVPMGLEKSDSGFLVYGGTNPGSNWDGFYVHFGANFSILSSERVGDASYQFTRTALHIGGDKFVVAGEYAAQKHTYIFEYRPGIGSYTAKIQDICAGVGDEGIKRLQLLDSVNKEYLLLTQNDLTTDAYFSVFNISYTIQSRSKIVQSADYLLKDMLVHTGTSELIRAVGNHGTQANAALALRTNKALDLCCIEKLQKPSVGTKSFTKSNFNLDGASNKRRAEGLTVTVASEVLSKSEGCPPDTVDISGDWMSQSPYLYLQSAGSDGVDETVKGFHLRWALKGILGDSHMPKGNLSGPYGSYPATYGFNKSDDFVKIYRTPFVNDYETKVDLSSQPSSYNVGGSVREWQYNNLAPQTVQNATTMNVIVSFPDTGAYDLLASSTPPASSTVQFLKNYPGEIQVRLEGKLAFRVDWIFGFENSGNLSNAVCRHEIIGLTDSTDTNSWELRYRDSFTQPDFSSATYSVCEDIYMLRFDRVNAYPDQLKFFCYEDYIQGTNENNAWMPLSDFSLTEDQTTAYKRLEDSPTFDIDGLWPKFNDDNSGTGKFKVRVGNYQDRWDRTDGLAFGVRKYLTLSESSLNQLAVESVPVTPKGQLVNNHEQEISYFNLLGIAAFDYHVSRMLGFGHIDANESANEADKYIYLAEYDTEGDLQDGQGARAVKHIYMTPHQTILDFKHSPVPELQNPITYGLAFDNGTSNPSQVTNANGYTPFADIRFVNLNRYPFQYEKPLQTFFEESNLFSLTATPQPVGFGVEYKEQGGSNVAPELSHDKYYSDAAAVPETNLIPNTGNNPLYRHMESREGVHCYQLYSVNWFSRTAGLSASVCTDETVFPVRNTIAPPANLSVQLIQPEVPLLLSTSAEQQAYEALTGDKTYVRAMFDWNYIQNQAYQFADKAQFFFHKKEKLTTKGQISGITQLSGHRLELTTTAYDLTSTTEVETITPTIPQALEAHFEGSLIAINGLNYRVESIVNTSGPSGENPKIVIHRIKETNSVETVAGSNVWTTTETYLIPDLGDRFLISENLTVGANWDNHLQKSLFLESFSTNDTLEVSGSTNNDGNYSIDAVNYSAPNTVLTVLEEVNDTVNDGSVSVKLRFPSVGFTTGNDGFLVEGDVTSYFALTGNVKIKGAVLNDGDYTLDTASFNGTHTEVTLNEALDLTSSVAYLYLSVSLAVADYNATNKTITIAGNYSGLIIPTYKEVRLNSDGSETTMVMGGVYGNCTITEDLDVYSLEDELGGYGTAGATIPGSRTGIYTITFNGNPLPPHIDPDVTWFRGKVRVPEDDSFLPTPLDARTTARMKELDVSQASENSGNLVLLATDPSFSVSRDLSLGTAFDPQGEYVPIATGSVQANYHPSYLLYLTVDETAIQGGGNNEFNEESILPDLNEGSRQTFLGLRAVDSEKNDPQTDNLASRMSVPAAINAMEIREPAQPGEPVGFDFATRPDFYGKSTFTIDIPFPNSTVEPYSVLVYKANAQKILDQLYKPSTVAEILENLETIGMNSNFPLRWKQFVNMVTDTNPGVEGLFNEFDGYRLPVPDSETYVIPSSELSVPVTPFDGNTTPPGESVTVVYNGMTMADIVKEAIESAFVSQTREPMIYRYLQNETDTDGQTSSAPPTVRNLNGDRLKPTDAAFNAHPNAIRMNNGDLRFTDYNIDGGAIDFYFYYAMELSDRQVKSPASYIFGPIQVINTRPAKKPGIKKVITKVENAALGIETAVCFQIEDYVKSENIVRIDIYRAIDPLDAMTIRTMQKAAEIDVSGGIAMAEICDTFEGLDYPLYGEDLHYRLVALREVTLEDGVSTEFIPSEASDLVKATLADPKNPSAPCITSENGTTTSTELQEVVLKWDQVCYNGTYRLQKMNSSGNWEEIYSIKSNDDVMQYPPLDGGGQPDFTNFGETAVLPRQDENGTAIYHRFRVQVENSSGLFNLSDCQRVLATGDFDLQVLPNYLSYEDDHGTLLTELASQEIDDGVNNNPTAMTFTANVPAVLPAGHNSFDELEVTVTDDQGNTFTKVITTLTGSVTFTDGEGGLLLDEANHTYTIVTKLTTDLTTSGYRTKTVLSYVHSPCNDLSHIAQILTVTDNTHTYDLDSASVGVNDASADAPVSLQFTDVSDVANLTIPQTFTSLDITVTDGLGNYETKQITTAGGSVTFDNSGPLVIDDGALNREFSVNATLITSECASGQQFSHGITYTYDPYVELQQFEDVIGYADSNGALISPLTSQNIDNDVNYPGSITITDILGANLPANHTFDEVEITLYDGLGGEHAQLISSAGGYVVFSSGQGPMGAEIELGSGNPNPTISIQVKVKTDLCPNGALFYYSLQYTYDPYVYLAAQTTMGSFSDANGVNEVLDTANLPLEFDNGSGDTNPGGYVIITDNTSGSLPPGDSLSSIDVTLLDGTGGEAMLTITPPATSVQFNNGTGGLALNGGNNGPVIDGHENKTFTVVMVVKTSLCPDGVPFVYSGRYTSGL